MRDLSKFPRIRQLEAQWVEYEGARYVYLKDIMALADNVVLIPEALAPLLVLCDGTRDISGLRNAVMLRHGLHLTSADVTDFLSKLDQAFLLEGERYIQASEKLLCRYRKAEYRLPSHDKYVYSDDPVILSNKLAEYCDKYATDLHSYDDIVGMVCPHIDFQRGHQTYAELWQLAKPSLEDVEVVIVFGTDHRGGSGTMTLTRQNYATPFGVLPTDITVVDALADTLSHEEAFSEEIHHVNEHSIELALVWIHYFMKRKPIKVVPILCGSFHDYMSRGLDSQSDSRMDAVMSTLLQSTVGRKTFVVAAGDLAHVGPAFGDKTPLNPDTRADIADRDKSAISSICEGDYVGFFNKSQAEQDHRRLCGLPPIYFALRYLKTARGKMVGYRQCPADEQNTSIVSITGVLFQNQ